MCSNVWSTLEECGEEAPCDGGDDGTDGEGIEGGGKQNVESQKPETRKRKEGKRKACSTRCAAIVAQARPPRTSLQSKHRRRNFFAHFLRANPSLVTGENRKLKAQGARATSPSAQQSCCIQHKEQR
jgi:hypothetical protein